MGFSRNEVDTNTKNPRDTEVTMKGNELIRYPRSATRNWVRKLGGLGVAFGLAAVLAVPAEVSAAPLYGAGIIGPPQTTTPELFGGNLQLIHCCHAHPYPPYDEYCCHGEGAAVAGAVVGGAIAYGVYRGVESSVHHHHYSGGHPGGGRPSGGRPSGGRPGGGRHR